MEPPETEIQPFKHPCGPVFGLLLLNGWAIEWLILLRVRGSLDHTTALAFLGLAAFWAYIALIITALSGCEGPEHRNTKQP